MRRLLARLKNALKVKDCGAITLFQNCTECGTSVRFEFRIIPNKQTVYEACWNCEERQRMFLDPRENDVYKSLVRKKVEIENTRPRSNAKEMALDMTTMIVEGESLC